jgi:hypothetical protein
MKKHNRRITDIFSLAFLDIIACGFGAIVLLLLIVKIDDPGASLFSGNDLIKNLFSLQDKKIPLDQELSQVNARVNNLQDSLKLKSSEEVSILKEVDSVRKQQFIIKKIQDNLNIAQQSLTEEMKRILQENKRDQEVGGIPVDSEYIIFIIDNSGSMKPAWAYVIREMKNIMDIHPTIKGIQVMNDQGEYLIKAYAGRGKWAPDTTSTREGILDMIKNSTNLGYSRSNPTKGIRTAITNHYIQGRKISIYLLGDDIMSTNVDITLDQIENINTNKLTGEKKVRIHGIVFAGLPHRNLIAYSNFMRHLSLRNEGTSLYIPIPNHQGWVDCPQGGCVYIGE